MQDIAKQVRDATRRKVVSHIGQPLKLLKHQGNLPIGLSESWGGGVHPKHFSRKATGRSYSKEINYVSHWNKLHPTFWHINRLILYAARQLIIHVEITSPMAYFKSHLAYIISIIKTLQARLSIQKAITSCFNFIHAFLVSCYLNACQMAIPTIFLRLQKVGWTTFKLIIEKKKGKVSEIANYLNAITKDDKLHALYFPSLSFWLINRDLMFKIATWVKPFWRPGSPIKHQG